MIGVRTDLDAYRVAIAELPLSTRLAPAASGAIVVADGPAALAAVADAAAIVLVDPAPGPIPELDGRIPIVVDREWLRADVAADAVGGGSSGGGESAATRAGAALLTAECSAPPGGVDSILRDAVGWLRVLSGDELTLQARYATEGGAMALLNAGDRSATLLLTVLADPAARPRLRVLAVGARRTEVEVDALGAASVTVSSEAGSLRLPARPESRQRLALRRAVEAAGGTEVRDLGDLRHDDAIAAAILGSYKQ